jgi:hypothetical protein
VVLLLASCSSENDLSLPAPPAGFPTAYATRDCAPADGPALRLYLAAEPSEALPPPSPFVDVAVWQGVGALSGKRVEWSGASSEGNARRCASADACAPATQVVLQFRPIGPDSSVRGTMSLTFADGSTVTGGFDAAWRSATMLCG